MKGYCFRSAAALAAFLCSVAASAGGPRWEWRQIDRHCECCTLQTTLFDSPQSISVLRYDPRHHRTLVANDPAEAADSTSAFGERYGALAAINGSYFNMKALTPVTYVKDDRAVEGMTTPDELFRVDGMVCVKGGKVVISRCDTLSYVSGSRRYTEAMAAGPVLLLDGQPARGSWPDEGFYTGRHPRTVIGTGNDGWVYFIVIDGRFSGQAIGTTIPETLAVAQMLGLKDALNLDGGGSSTLWISGMGVVSHPYDNHCFDHSGQRIVPNCILVK